MQCSRPCALVPALCRGPGCLEGRLTDSGVPGGLDEVFVYALVDVNRRREDCPPPSGPVLIPGGGSGVADPGDAHTGH